MSCNNACIIILCQVSERDKWGNVEKRNSVWWKCHLGLRWHTSIPSVALEEQALNHHHRKDHQWCTGKGWWRYWLEGRLVHAKTPPATFNAQAYRWWSTRQMLHPTFPYQTEGMMPLRLEVNWSHCFEGFSRLYPTMHCIFCVQVNILLYIVLY